jgi:hypothetical protein
VHISRCASEQPAYCETLLRLFGVLAQGSPLRTLLWPARFLAATKRLYVRPRVTARYKRARQAAELNYAFNVHAHVADDSARFPVRTSVTQAASD